jgi:FixJ family two-component response regulator
LTPREREVLREMVKGRLNKQIAFDLGISEIHSQATSRQRDAETTGRIRRP